MRYLRLLGILGIVAAMIACAAPVPTTARPTPDIPATIAAKVRLRLAPTPTRSPIPVIDVPRTRATPLPPPLLLPAATPELNIAIPPPYPPDVAPPPTSELTYFYPIAPEPAATPIPYPTVPVERAVMATMEPFSTLFPIQEHPVAWKVHSPRNGLYRFNLPADWEHQESRFRQDSGELPVFQEISANPAYTAKLTVTDYPAQEGYDVYDAFTNLLPLFDEVTGFEVVTIDEVSDEVIRVMFLYDAIGPSCGLVNFYGILAVTASHSYHLNLEICSTFGTAPAGPTSLTM